MYYVKETILEIYLCRIELGSWTPKENVFGPEIKYNDDDF